MKPVIEFCLSNLASGTDVVMERLKQDPHLDVIEYGCLGFCGLCTDAHFALVNGEFVGGATCEDILKAIDEELKKLNKEN